MPKKRGFLLTIRSLGTAKATNIRFESFSRSPNVECDKVMRNNLLDILPHVEFIFISSPNELLFCSNIEKRCNQFN